MVAFLRRLKRWLRNLLGFTQRETNGFLLLLLAMTVALFAPLLFSLFLPAYDPSADKQLLDSLVAQLEMAAPPPDAGHKQDPEIISGKLPSQPFDPNTLTAEDWTKIGLSKPIADRIKKYQAKGGMFRSKEDVARIYGFPEELYYQLYPLLDLPTREELIANRGKPRYPAAAPRQGQTASAYPSGSRASRYVPLQLFDINQADTTQLMRVRGIGSKRAQWIVKHRGRLGGFISTAQFAEVFGLDSAVVDSLQKYAYVAPDFSPQKVHVNRMTADELARHPYFTFKAARALVAYRGQHGPFAKPEDLLKVRLITDDMVRKLQPYLAF